MQKTVSLISWPAVAIVAIVVVLVQLDVLAAQNLRPTWITVTDDTAYVNPAVRPPTKKYPGAAIGLGSEVLIKKFGFREKVKWGSEYLYNPSRAAEKSLFYIYKIDQLAPGDLHILLSRFAQRIKFLNWAYIPASFHEQNHGVPHYCPVN